MKKIVLFGLGTAMTAVLLALPASAHPGHGDEAHLAFGALHPMGVLEYLSLMLVIGVFALALVRIMGARR